MLVCFSVPSLDEATAYLHRYLPLVSTVMPVAVIAGAIFAVYFVAFYNRINTDAGLPQFTGDPSPPSPPKGPHVPSCRPPTSPYDSTCRTIICDVETYIYAWPSKGGVIIRSVDAIDMEFLGLDPFNPPPKKLPDQKDEDEFCRRLLLLGGTWWESERRYCLVSPAYDNLVPTFEEGTEPLPTFEERRVVVVGWPTTGGVWITDWDRDMCNVDEEDNLVPGDTGRLRMARTMDERCKILRDYFHAKFYLNPRHYKGFADFYNWSEIEDGERGAQKRQKLGN